MFIIFKLYLRLIFFKKALLMVPIKPVLRIKIRCIRKILASGSRSAKILCLPVCLFKING